LPIADTGCLPYTLDDRNVIHEPSERRAQKQLRQQGVDVLRIECQSPLRLALHEVGARGAIGERLIEAQPRPQECQPTPSLREMRGELRRDLQQADVGPQFVWCVRSGTGAQIEVIDRRIDCLRREAREGLVECDRDVLGDFVLHGKDVFEAAVVAVRP
jgi:hypothetical protein